MDYREKNPTRCKELREIERELFRQIDKVVSNQKREEDSLKIVMDKHSKLSSELYELQRKLISSTPLLLTPGRVGAMIRNGIETIDMNISIRIAYLEAQIKELEPIIKTHERQVEYYRKRKYDLDYELQRNASNMRELSCVTD